MFNHAANLWQPVMATGVFLAVGDDGHHHFAGTLVLRAVFLQVANPVDGHAQRIKQGSVSRLVVPCSHGFCLQDIDAVMHDTGLVGKQYRGKTARAVQLLLTGQQAVVALQGFFVPDPASSCFGQG